MRFMINQFDSTKSHKFYTWDEVNGLIIKL